MSDFASCPAECPTTTAYFDSTCARLEYPDLVHLLGGLDLFFNKGLTPGHFLLAVLSNDLQEAFSRADVRSAAALPQLVKLLYNHAPAVAFGSASKVAEWRRRVRAEMEA